MNEPKLISRVALRLAVGLVAFLALGGPSPGHLGSCTGLSAPPDPYRYCVDTRGEECRRDVSAGRINVDVEFPACVDAILPRCEGVVAWPSCVPTSAQTLACLEALRDTNRYSTPSNELPECNQASWCPAGI
jgi:hypothetical protein